MYGYTHTYIQIKMVSAPVRGRVGDDIRQSQDDGGNARNWSNLHIIFFSINLWLKFHGRVTSKLETPVCYHNETVILCPGSFVEKFLFFVSSQGWAETVFERLNILMFKRCLNAKCLNNLAEDGMMIGNVKKKFKQI